MARSLPPLVPSSVRNPCTMWAQKSTHRPTLGYGDTQHIEANIKSYEAPDDDHVHAGDVDGEPPPVHVPTHVHTTEENAPDKIINI